MKDKNGKQAKVKYQGQKYSLISFEFDINKVMIGTVSNGKPIQIFSVDPNEIEFTLSNETV